MKKHYINEKELHKEMTVSLAKGKLTPRAAELLILLPENVINKFSYYRDHPQDREDVIQSACLTLLTKYTSFNPEYAALPYFTEICKRAIAMGFYELKGIKPYHNGEYSIVHFEDMVWGRISN